MKLSKWMGDKMDGHGMYDKAYVEKNLLRLTGIKFNLPSFSAGHARSQIGKHPKGPVFVKESLPDEQRLVAGYSVADIVADQLLGRDPAPHIDGRGSRFRACVSALQDAGL